MAYEPGGGNQKCMSSDLQKLFVSRRVDIESDNVEPSRDKAPSIDLTHQAKAN